MRKLAQELRRNMTPEEKQLWYQFLRRYPVQFRRQVVFGQFIVDFYCAKAKLVVELDGNQHYLGNGPAYDAERTEYLNGKGFLVVRYPNTDIRQHFDAVCKDIDQIVQARVSERFGRDYFLR